MDLDHALLEAHDRNDKPALVALYTQAAKTAASEEARAFYLTHAFVFALETHAPERRALGAELRQMGRL